MRCAPTPPSCWLVTLISWPVSKPARFSARSSVRAPTGPGDGPLADGVVLLDRARRFGASSQIAALADAIRLGDDNRAVDLLGEGFSDELTWVRDDDKAGISGLQQAVARSAVEVIRKAQSGDDHDAEEGLGLASEVKVLCATRFGPLGVFAWSACIEAIAARELPGTGIGGRSSYVGRPIIVTRNDYLNKLFNGDVGLVVAGPIAVFRDPSSGLRKLALSQLGDIDTWWATTIHKSQGSEFGQVIVTLPRPPSPILTRELLYTAVTRAKNRVTVVAAEESLRAAIRRPVARASGLRDKLWPGASPATRT